jgi:hypothetical protein
LATVAAGVAVAVGVAVGLFEVHPAMRIAATTSTIRKDESLLRFIFT